MSETLWDLAEAALYDTSLPEELPECLCAVPDRRATKDTPGRNGAHWIREDLRAAIYLRDRDPANGRLRCLLCGYWENRVRRLSLDHIVPVSFGGKNDPSNLYTACVQCNAARHDAPLTQWLIERGNRDGLRRVLACLQLPIDRAAGKALAEKRRGSRETTKQALQRLYG